jgi:hypothetical protein
VEGWQFVIAPLEQGLSEVSQYLAGLPRGVLIAGLIVPVVIALASRHLVGILAVVMLVVASFAMLLAPTAAVTTLALASYVGGLLVAVLSVRSRQSQSVKVELAALRADVDSLMQAESRRMIAELRSDKSGANVTAHGAGERGVER